MHTFSVTSLSVEVMPWLKESLMENKHRA